MREFWIPALSTPMLPADKPVGFTLYGDRLVFWRDAKGEARCAPDICPHRSAPLSLGRVTNGDVECPYHGWRFGGDGACTHIPSLAANTKPPARACLTPYPTVERWGFIWVWMGTPALATPDTIPDYSAWVGPGWDGFEDTFDLDIDHGLMVENLLDPSHIPFTHEGTLGKRGDAKPLDLAVEDHPSLPGAFVGLYKNSTVQSAPEQRFRFFPPCVVILDFQLKAGWHFVQLQHCLPVAPGKMRLHYRLQRDWLTFIPGMNLLMTHQSRKIVAQDVAMLAGEQARLDEGFKPWNASVDADRFALRYRAWRARHDRPEHWQGRAVTAVGASVSPDPAPTEAA